MTVQFTKSVSVWSESGGRKEGWILSSMTLAAAASSGKAHIQAIV
jgi:hypothetical protein